MIDRILRVGLEEYLDGLKKVLSGLSRDERRFQPAGTGNHIDFIVWHMARNEDETVQGLCRGVPELWTSERWFERLGLPEEGDGFGYSLEDVTNLPTFGVDDCLAYFDRVRAETVRYLEGLTESELDRLPNADKWPTVTVARALGHLIVEQGQHLGHIGYIRGLLRGVEFATSWNNPDTPVPT